MPNNRADPAHVAAMDNPVSFAADSADKVRALVAEAKAALAHLHKLVLPKLPQDKSLHDLAETFIIKEKTAVEVLKRNSKIYGAVLALQLLLASVPNFVLHVLFSLQRQARRRSRRLKMVQVLLRSLMRCFFNSRLIYVMNMLEVA